MRQSIFAALLLLLCTNSRTASAQVPQLISYQGRIAVSGANFNGTEQFKFAFVSSDGSNASHFICSNSYAETCATD